MVKKLGQIGQGQLQYVTSFFETRLKGSKPLSVCLKEPEGITEEQSLFLESEQPLLRSLGLLDSVESIKDLGMTKQERELEGSFYTPLVWAKKAHNLLSDISDLEDYVVWDASCGTGNLLIEFPKCKHLYLSTLHGEDVQLTKARFEKERPDLAVSVFQMDFLGSFDSAFSSSFKSQLPKGLQEVLEKNQKLIILMNPPYSTKGLKTEVACHLSLLKEKGYIADLYTQFIWQVNNLVSVYQLTKTELIWMVPISLLVGGRTVTVRRGLIERYCFKGGFLSPLADFTGSSGVVSNYLCTTRWSTQSSARPSTLVLDLYKASDENLGGVPFNLSKSYVQLVKKVLKETRFSSKYVPLFDSKGRVVSDELVTTPDSDLGVVFLSSLSYLSLTKNQMTTAYLQGFDTSRVRPITEDNFADLVVIFALKFVRDLPLNFVVSQSRVPIRNQTFENVYLHFVILAFVSRELYAYSTTYSLGGKSEYLRNPFFFLTKEEVYQAICENKDETSRDALLKDFSRWSGFPLFYQEELRKAVSSELVNPLFKEVLGALRSFYLEGLRSRIVVDDLSSLVDLGFHQVKELEGIPDSLFQAYLEKQRTLKSLVLTLLESLQFEI